ncbi:MAG: Gfo/Idh/MocA family oxidoreductase [Chloroflexi bacterium]|nr:Gfo/Idh/MocA family oxidoreductase [Chloroflexota bacterium]
MKRYALVGTGGRGIQAYGQAIVQRHAATAQLVGLYDRNPLRAQFARRELGGAAVYATFEELLRVAQPDVVIVTCVDRYHHEYIVQALEAGCDVISEKPMTIDADKVRAILAAERRTGRKVTVTFNVRHMPYVTRAKEILRSGVIGEILSADMEWVLDRSHGASYFRRWHRMLANSGGLLVHKATHHFDMINWLIEAEPQTVFAQGALRVYGRAHPEHGERCSGCPHTRTCEFYWDASAQPRARQLYLDNESADGYHIDGCVFDPAIDIYDTMSANVRYTNGVQLSYSLNAHRPWEGWAMALNGRLGRLEIGEFYSGQSARDPNQHVTLYNNRGEKIVYDIPKVMGGHGGADELLTDRLFGERQLPDPLGLMAGSWAGAMSVLIGAAANQSIATGQPVDIDSLLGEFART